MTEREPDPETNAEMWADRAPRGWVRCAGCGDEWAVEDDCHKCKCESEEDEVTGKEDKDDADE